MSSTTLEVAKDIVVALINKQSGSVGAALTPAPAAEEVAKAFEIVFDMVKKKNNGG